MRPDLIVPGEEETSFEVEKDPTVVELPFSPLEERMSKEKPYLMEGLKMLHTELGEDGFKRLISRIHNINVSGERCLIVAESELHRTNIEREAIPAIAKAFKVSNIRVVSMG
jgi:hypothetical protein